MTQIHTFNSRVERRGQFNDRFTDEEIKNEPMLFNCDFESARSLGGKITKQFLAALPLDWQADVVVDSRVHMLMAGWYPCIPGFHHDDVPRTPPNNQPRYDAPLYKSEHLMGLVNGHIAPTVFALGTHVLPSVKDDVVYKRWHPIVEEQISMGILKEWEAPSGELIQFDWQTMHTGQKARSNGWRWFIRLSRNTDRIYSITNEVRRQVQVYLEFPMEGW